MVATQKWMRGRDHPQRPQLGIQGHRRCLWSPEKILSCFRGQGLRADIVSQASSSGGGPAGQRREESGEVMQSTHEETATMGGFHTPRRSSRTSLFPDAVRPPSQGVYMVWLRRLVSSSKHLLSHGYQALFRRRRSHVVPFPPSHWEAQRFFRSQDLGLQLGMQGVQ